MGRLARLSFWLVPGGVLIWAYGYLAFEYHTANLLFVPIHENGKSTLLESVFSFNHFAREILICLMTSFFAAAAFSRDFSVEGAVNSRFHQRVLRGSLFLALLILGGSLWGAVTKEGWNQWFLDFFQFRTRENQIAYGSHWNSHFLHLLFVFFFSPVLAFLYRSVAGTLSGRVNVSATRLSVLGFVLFVVFSFIFIPAPEIFTDTRCVAHAFREIMTHSSVTLPLTFAALGAVEERMVAGPTESSLSPSQRKSRFRRVALSGLAAFAILLFMGMNLAHRDILAVAQKKSSLTDLLASHYFEHAIDYLFVPLSAVFLFALFIPRKGSRFR